MYSLIDSEYFTKNTLISGNIDVDKIRPALRNAQLYRVKDVLGEALYDKVMDLYEDDLLTGDYLTLYEKYLKDLLLHAASEIYIASGSITVSNKGIQQLTDLNGNVVSQKEIDRQINFYRGLYNDVREKMIIFLNSSSITEWVKTNKQNRRVGGWINSGSGGTGITTYSGSGGTGTQGVQGIQGIQGPIGSGEGGGTQGVQGIQGLQGPIGLQGSIGAQGETGLQGAVGEQGETGAQGTTGQTGAQGTIGETGTQGIQGQTGAQGTIGETGAQGTIGTQGNTGTQGTIGQTGAQGIQGIQGITGNTGAQGTIGTQGNTGTQGTTGQTGAQGIQGNTGTTGAQGTIGQTGAQGTQGLQGTQGTFDGDFINGVIVDGTTIGYLENDSNWTPNYSGPTVSGTYQSQFYFDNVNNWLFKAVDDNDWIRVKANTDPVTSDTITTLWSGTQIQYDALGTYSNTTIYFIE